MKTAIKYFAQSRLTLRRFVIMCARLERKMTTNFQANEENAPHWLRVVSSQVGSLRYGVVQIVVHAGEVVQIERTEKVRLDRPEDRSVHTTNSR